MDESFETSPKTFLRIAEFWKSDKDGQALEHVSGYYSTHAVFGDCSRSLSFSPGVGLIGRCAQRNTPILLEELSRDSDFLRSDAALRDGLNVGLAVPWKTRKNETGVLALFFANALDEPSGGVEVWAQQPSTEILGLACAYHGLAEDFRRMSSLLTFAKGEGLPGRVAQRKAPEALRIAENSREFLRAVAAETSGFVHAVGLPVLVGALAALVLLGQRDRPIALLTEVWRRVREGEFERCTSTKDEIPFPFDFERESVLRQADETRQPITFEQNDGAKRIAYGGVVLPYESSDGFTFFCILVW